MTIVLTCINALSWITVSYSLSQTFIIIALWPLTLQLQFSFGRADALCLSSMSTDPTKYSCPVSSILLHTNSECACIMKARIFKPVQGTYAEEILNLSFGYN